MQAPAEHRMLAPPEQRTRLVPVVCRVLAMQKCRIFALPGQTLGTQISTTVVDIWDSAASSEVQKQLVGSTSHPARFVSQQRDKTERLTSATHRPSR